MRNENMKLILASGSPRRKDLLKRENIDFIIDVSNEEEVITETEPSKVVMSLSLQKAEAVMKKHTEDCVLLAADTVVSAEGKILGKPASEKEAYEMIQMISGKAHQVYTGVTLIKQVDLKRTVKQFYVSSDVYVKDLSREEIQAYIATGESMDKAGAYAIQGIFGKYIDHIEGDYDNIVGLPVTRVKEELNNL